MVTKRKVIHCAVTNDLNQDQRMHRICNTLQELGYEVTLIGRQKKHSVPLLNFEFNQKRIFCFFQKGFLFYVEYNLRLFWYLLTHHQDIIYGVDSDTLMPCTWAKVLKGKKMIFDAHEYFTEVPELTNRPTVKKVWTIIENLCIPKVDLALTVNQSLAKLFSKKFGIAFHTLYNVPLKSKSDDVMGTGVKHKSYILYQGVLNQGRGLEVLIESMEFIRDVDLVLVGEGDLSDSLRTLVKTLPYRDRIIFKGWQSPSALKEITKGATLGINLLDDVSLNYYYSLANKFFDYMHAGVPSVNMNFPEYLHILEEYQVGYTVAELTPHAVAEVINNALTDTAGLSHRTRECMRASLDYHWQNEAQKLGQLMDDPLGCV